MHATLPVSARIWFAFVCFFRVLFDGAFAARAFAARSASPELPEPSPESSPEPPAAEPAPREPDPTPAYQLLALLQREGRLVDFVQQDITSFEDAEVGAAARVVHEGCRRALSSHLTIEPLSTEVEGSRVELAAFDPDEIKLVGNVGKREQSGTVRHRGWRARSLELPRIVGDHDVQVLAPIEVEV